MRKPAARISDMHSCPAATPAPHVGGPITGTGCVTVLIGGQPAATVGDCCTCTGPPDVIIAGSSGVFIGGKPAARMGDQTAHGGVIISGCGNVLIGETKKKTFYRKPGLYDPEYEDYPESEPSKEEKRAALLQAIQDGIRLLENKLKLLKEDDVDTLEQFTIWFGKDDLKSKRIIIERIEREIAVFKELTEDNFEMMKDEDKRRKLFASVLSDDESYTIYLGYSFWQTKALGISSKAWVLIHEVSHFDNVGKTRDHAYGEECISYAEINPKRALYNADSFAFFIKS